MTNNISALEVRAIACGLELKIFGEFISTVADMETSNKDIITTPGTIATISI